jgi:hypothetical protein
MSVIVLQPPTRGDRPVTTLVERLALPAALPRARSRRDTETVQFAQAALAAAKQEGLQLAVRARYVALAVIACLLPIINPTWEQLYYVVLLGLFALIGWGQVRVGRVGVSRPELALLFCDLALLKAFAAALVAVAVLCAIDFEYNDGLYTKVIRQAATSLLTVSERGAGAPALALQIFSGKLRKVTPW